MMRRDLAAAMSLPPIFFSPCVANGSINWKTAVGLHALSVWWVYLFKPISYEFLEDVRVGVVVGTVLVSAMSVAAW